MADNNDDIVRLTDTDFRILEALTDGRNVAANLQHEIDATRTYINSRFGMLYDYGLVDRVGESERVGLYEITAKGRIALEAEDEYDDVDSREFTELVDSRLAERDDVS